MKPKGNIRTHSLSVINIDQYQQIEQEYDSEASASHVENNHIIDLLCDCKINYVQGFQLREPFLLDDIV